MNGRWRRMNENCEADAQSTTCGLYSENSPRFEANFEFDISKTKCPPLLDVPVLKGLCSFGPQL